MKSAYKSNRDFQVNKINNIFI